MESLFAEVGLRTQDSYRIRIITIPKSLRRSLRGRKQSQAAQVIASYLSNDYCYKADSISRGI